MRIKKTEIYDIVKVMSMLLVVFEHVFRMYTPTGVYTPRNASIFLNYAAEYLTIFLMPLFMFLSGAIYHFCVSQGKYEQKLLFVKNKIKRLLIPYLLCGFFCVAPVMQMLQIDRSGYLKYWYNGILLVRNSRHLWYLAALFWIYIFAMLLSFLWEKPKGKMLLICLSCICTLYAYKLPRTFQIRAAFQYQFYFLLGLFFDAYYEKIESAFFRYRYRFICMFALLPVYFIWNPNRLTDVFYKCMGILMMVSLGQWFVMCKSDILENNIYKILARDSFGIYLFHPMIIYVLFYLWKDADVSPFFLSGVIIVISLILSILLTVFMRKYKMKAWIGE